MATNDENNRFLKDFTVPLARELNMGYTVPAVAANDF
jgi:hypothetical protein